jgi:hypothetical protein
VRRDYPAREANEAARRAWLRMVPADRYEKRALRMDRRRGLTREEMWRRRQNRRVALDLPARQWLARELPPRLQAFIGGQITPWTERQMQAVADQMRDEAERIYRYVPDVRVTLDRSGAIISFSSPYV